MYVGNVAEKIESSGLGEGNAFTIAASAKAFEVLSSNLYQNKILAVIREISCNAADAHRMAGLPLSGIKVHLPTYTEPYFAVRDFGPGLSHTDVLSLYTTYFRSTKDSDNSQIGGFGLGSKSPFAVADQFTVTSWHGGYKRSYICYKDGGLPRVNSVGEQPCPLTETGIEVQVAARDFHSWEREAANFFKWWPELPVITTGSHGYKIEPITFAMDGCLVSPNKVDGLPEWAFLPGGYTSQVFMGLVPYALSWSAIPNVPKEVSDLLYNTAVFLRLPIGAVSISPSREALSYDPSTCTVLLQKLREIVREAAKVFKTSLDEQPTLYDARKFIYSKENSGLSRIMTSMATGGALTWNGQRLEQQIHIDASDFGTGITFDMVVKKYHHKNPQRYLQSGVHYDHSANSSDRIYWSATAPRNYAATFMHNFNPLREWRVLIIKGGTYADACKVCLDKGLPEPIDYADLEVPPAAPKGSRSAQTKPTGYVINQTDHSYSRTTAPIDLKGGGIYLEFVNGEPPYNYRRALLSLRLMGFLGVSMNPTVIGLSKAMLDKSKSLQLSLTVNGWSRFDADWVAAHVPTQFLEDHYKSGSIIAWLNQHPALRKSSYTTVTWKGAETLLDIVRPYINRNYDYNKYGDHESLKALMSGEQIKAMERGKNVGYGLAAKWKAFLDMHPMLHHVNFLSIPAGVLNAYINR
jgi:hypothetical protein